QVAPLPRLPGIRMALHEMRRDAGVDRRGDTVRAGGGDGAWLTSMLPNSAALTRMTRAAAPDCAQPTKRHVASWIATPKMAWMTSASSTTCLLNWRS